MILSMKKLSCKAYFILPFPHLFIGFLWSQQHLDWLWRDTAGNLGCILGVWSPVLSLRRSKKTFIIYSIVSKHQSIFSSEGNFSMDQGSEILWTWILEVRWGRKQVLSSCHRTVICHFQWFGHLYIQKSVSITAIWVQKIAFWCIIQFLVKSRFSSYKWCQLGHAIRL